MKIGLYGGMANNMYVFAKAFEAQGVDLCFIRDRKDRYPMSQPVWEDCSFSMKYEEIDRAKNWTWGEWSDFEKKLEWKEPQWIFDPQTSENKEIVEAGQIDSYVDRSFLRWYINTAHRGAVLEQMRKCDALLVCGVEEAILASLSEKPYIILPFGGDLMIAAGLLKPPFANIKTRIFHELLRKVLVRAYGKATCIGVHEPTAFSNDYYGAENFFRKQKIYFLAIPIPVRQRQNKELRREALNKLLIKHDCSAVTSEFVGFVPSRIDYEWKGQNRLLEALRQVERNIAANDLHLIFSGWGNDYNKAKLFVHTNGLKDKVTFLPCALSKPSLYEFYSSADFVIDQFIVGMTGTSSLEAMSCGAPLMMWLNDQYERPWGAPPIIQAKNSHEIGDKLLQIVQRKIDLEEVGEQLKQYITRLHNPAIVVPNLIERLRKEA